ncbi:MAG: RibD family protein [Verrucomicrobium sp.]|nr:RibD family protein [Verrucomicrobium sp.]
MRPHIICFMLSSVDGRIQSRNWGIGDTAKIYEGRGAKIKADGWIVGRVTMQEFSSKKPYRAPKGTFRIPKTDYVAPYNAKTFAVAIDPQGKCHWDSGMVDTEHVIAVLTERVPASYLAHLREKGVSYVFAGKSSLDLARALAKLRKLFPIKTLMLQGGGGVNGSFLKAGLIDELRLLLLPVADGTMGTPTLFDAERGYTGRKGVKFRLRALRRLPKGFVWLEYVALHAKK